MEKQAEAFDPIIFSFLFIAQYGDGDICEEEKDVIIEIAEEIYGKEMVHIFDDTLSVYMNMSYEQREHAVREAADKVANLELSTWQNVAKWLIQVTFANGIVSENEEKILRLFGIDLMNSVQRQSREGEQVQKQVEQPKNKKEKVDQLAKSFLIKVTEAVVAFTLHKITTPVWSSKYNTWKSFTYQTKPHWEDISWRVKQPDENGDAELTFGFYSAKPTKKQLVAIKKFEKISEGHVDQIVKSDNGINLVWKKNLNNQQEIDEVLKKISALLPELMRALKEGNLVGISVK
jgi:hypothetical protein